MSPHNRPGQILVMYYSNSRIRRAIPVTTSVSEGKLQDPLAHARGYNLKRFLSAQRSSLLFVCFVVTSVLLRAEPLSKSLAVDFFRDVPSRNLKGLATRSDGRLVPGPVLRELAGPVPAELLWCLERGASPAQWFVGTGPDGRILEVTVDVAAGSYTTRPVVKLDDAQVFAVRRLPDG